MESKQISDILRYLNANRKLTNIFSRLYRRYLIYKLYRECDKKGAFIPESAQIGDNIVFPHGINGIFISQGAVIGKNAVIFHQVTIGSNSLKDSKGFGSPIIGNNVYIGAGAKIIGHVNIGDNVRIGANAVVTCNVPSNSTVVQEAPRIIMHDTKKDNSFKVWK